MNQNRMATKTINGKIYPINKEYGLEIINFFAIAAPKTVHCKKEKYDTYIGRKCYGLPASKWGNPFVIGKDGTRDEVIEKYRQWIVTQPQLIKDLPELKGKILGCWCAPLKCHGEVLLELLKNE